MLQDYLIYILRNFSQRKVRGWLTIIGIFIGIASVVALISITMGMQQSIQSQFEKLGTNKLIVMPGNAGFLGSSYASKNLNEDDLDVIRRVSGVDVAASIIFKSAKVKFKDEVKYTFVIAFPTSEVQKVVRDVGGFEIEFGRNFKDGDKYKAAIGYLTSQSKKDGNIFDKPIKLGNKIYIEDQEFEVTGIMKKIGNPQDDNQIYIPLETAREIFNEPKDSGFIYVQTKKGTDLESVAEEIKKELRKFKDEKKGEESFQVQTAEQILSQFNTILKILSIVLITISAISLIVGGIGIMNSMYTSVLERTHEIGIMKAVGARNSHILTIFLIESGLYGLIGGILGVLLGVGLALTAQYFAAQAGASIFKASITPTLIIGSLLFSFVVGCISGLAPARAAAKMKPVDALRYE